MAVKQKKQAELNVNELKNGMIITAYTSFSSNYRPMDKSTADFIRHNFRDSRAIIKRAGREQDIPIHILMTGDELIRIHSMPLVLKKLMYVNQALVKELKKRGMMGFQVKSSNRIADESRRDLQKLIQQVEETSEIKSRKGLTVVQEKRQKKADIANKLINKVREGLTYRLEAAASVENTMDLIRNGKTSINDIRHFARSIVKNASTDAMTALAGLKGSDQIYSHCVDVGAIFQSTYSKIIEKKGARSVFENQFDVFTAALLHDVGKSKIPKEIIDSTEHYEKNSRATQILRSHPIFGAEFLAKVDMPNIMINMTHHHHVKQETSMLSSYPAGVNFKDVMFETRLLSIVDIYQALVGKRKYKRSWSPPATMRYLDALAGIEYDLRVWEPFLQIMGIYPKGSLVKLSDKSLGFVMNVPRPGQNLEKPLIAIIQNSSGETMTHHDIIDLSVEKEIKIVKDMDSQEIFGDKALAVFTSISIS